MGVFGRKREAAGSSSEEQEEEEKATGRARQWVRQIMCDHRDRCEQHQGSRAGETCYTISPPVNVLLI